MNWETIEKRWSNYKNLAAIRGMLQWFGIWDVCVRWLNRVVGAVLAAIAILIWSRFRALAGPVQTTIALLIFASTLAVWSLVLHFIERYGQAKADAPPLLPLLFVRMYSERPCREDLVGFYLLRVFLRNDYGRPIGVHFCRWEDHKTERTSKAYTNFVKLRGLRVEDSRRADRIGGTEKVLVPTNQAFSLNIDVRHADLVKHRGDVLDDAQPLGTFTLSIEGKQISFPLTYSQIKEPEVPEEPAIPFISFGDTSLSDENAGIAEPVDEALLRQNR